LPENPSPAVPATFLSDLQVISTKGVEEEEEREIEAERIEQNEDGKENEEPSMTLLAKKNSLKKTTTSSSVLPLVGPTPTPFSLAVQLRRTSSKKNINDNSTGNVFIPQLRKTGIRRT
jgi:hypothetical protein